METAITKNEKEPTKLAQAVAEAIFSTEQGEIPNYDPSIPMPMCGEEDLKQIFKAMEAHSGTKIGDARTYKPNQDESYLNKDWDIDEEGKYPKQNFNSFVNINLWRSAVDTSIRYDEQNNKIIQNENDARIVSLLMNVPRVELRQTGLGNGQSFLLRMQDSILKGEKPPILEGYSKYFPITVDNNLVGVFLEREEKLNPCTNPMFAVIIEVRPEGKLIDAQKLFEAMDVLMNVTYNQGER